MTEQEQFEADFLNAGKGGWSKKWLEKYEDGQYRAPFTARAYYVWKQQAARHKAEVVELVKAISESLEAELAPFPPFEQGKEAQDQWADRKAAARNNFAAIIAKYEGAKP